MRKQQSGFAMIALLFVMAVVYFIALRAGASGWGYMGYRGYHHGPHWSYWGGPNVYHNPSVRSGSSSGPNVRGGGFGSGK